MTRANTTSRAAFPGATPASARIWAEAMTASTDWTATQPNAETNPTPAGIALPRSPKAARVLTMVAVAVRGPGMAHRPKRTAPSTLPRSVVASASGKGRPKITGRAPVASAT
jgi:hypothetical protein